MARDSVSPATATLYDLQQPEKLRNVVAKDSFDDCLSCRLTGAAAFGGLGAYSWYTGHQNLQLQKAKILKSGSRFGMKSRQAGVNGIALTLIGLGMWRLVN